MIKLQGKTPVNIIGVFFTLHNRFFSCISENNVVTLRSENRNVCFRKNFVYFCACEGIR